MARAELRTHQVRALVRLINEAHELPADGDARARHLISGLLGILHATVGGCVTDCDFRPGGHGAFVAVVLEGWDSTTLPVLQVLARTGSAFNPGLRALMQRCPESPSSAVTATRRELVADRDWYGSQYVEQHLGPAHLDDALYTCLRMDEPTVVQGLGFYRARNERPFDEADRNLVHLFHVECESMFRARVPAVDKSLRARLSPRERQTLELLLRGLMDKEIAEHLGISRFTVNQYTKSVYRRFGVHSRAALIARLLGHQPPAARAWTP
ncbi:helix-turn-helix transcriptional regulator [Archangium minus]|uniref:Helix-turn-helix transcriptional regulator n=1 Tax=Archangium minus TaxID=83450 RepID=A0ABY9WW96_9BACT|nr:helix-turn-helix transcriptional regulator [Archangium minus]